MSIQGGMLEALGINMYTTLGKCLVEFVANAFDAEAGSVEITMPVEKIDVARKEVRNAAKVEAAAMVKEAGYKPARKDPLARVARGHQGIDPRHRQRYDPGSSSNAFLPVNRKRRLGAGGKRITSRPKPKSVVIPFEQRAGPARRTRPRHVRQRRAPLQNRESGCRPWWRAEITSSMERC